MNLTLGLFIEVVESDPLFFISFVVTIVVSITLHELAHGYAAIWLGDDTPIVLKRMTLNPLVHMGLWSLVSAVVIGMAWGQMPVNPSRLRGKHGDAWVAVAGPACNVLLAVIALTGLGLWERWGEAEVTGAAANWQNFLWYFGYINVCLAMFNMLPAPPLDGSRVLASFSYGYRRWMEGMSNSSVMLMVILGLIMMTGQAGFGIWELSSEVARWYRDLILTTG